MTRAYSPGLKVAERVLIRKRRILPVPGRVMVELGRSVAPDDVVARTELPGRAELVNVANLLNVEPAELPAKMIKREGEPVTEGEIIAVAKSFFGLFKNRAPAKLAGVIEKINPVTGQVLLRGPALPVEVKAYLAGEVVEILPGEGCVVQTSGALVQGIFGIGGETHGELAAACAAPDQPLTPDLLTDDLRDRIVLGGGRVTAEALKKAVRLGVRGVVTGGFDDRDLRDFLGYDLGVAITGAERLGLTLIITEGFGDIGMADKTFQLLRAQVGQTACVNGATQIRAGVIRPEVLVPLPSTTPAGPAEGAAGPAGLALGSLVRVIRVPWFGRLGRVSDLPPEPRALESGSLARVLEVTFSDGARAIVPRANVELIES